MGSEERWSRGGGTYGNGKGGFVRRLREGFQGRKEGRKREGRFGDGEGGLREGGGRDGVVV